MVYTSLLMVHVCGAVVGLLSGFLSMMVRKGAGLHQVAGTIFFGSMLGMSGSGALIAAFIHPLAINLIFGLITFYLVWTAWRAARQRQGGRDLLDYGAFLLITAVGVGSMSIAARYPTKTSGNVPAGAFVVFALIAFLCSIADIRMFVRGGYIGARRIARHLWRMCLALLIATLSFYPGQAKLFSKSLRATNFLYIPLLLVIGWTLFWLARSAKKGERYATNES